MAKIITKIPTTGIYEHNDLNGLNLGDYQHLTQNQKINLEYVTNKQDNLNSDPTNIKYPTVNAVINGNIDTLNSANTYTDSKLTSVYKYKGSVPSYINLPTIDNVVGDVWNVVDTDINYAWTGTEWDSLGGTVDISGKEDKSNKQNSLLFDGTGQKYPTVDAVNIANNLKLDKGSYTGNAQDLKNDIDSIYQPNILIEYTDPTRSVNTFTFPALGYTALINKIEYENTNSFITTISAATTDYKRTDLIYITTGGIINKKIGVENISVAVRPEVNDNEVAIAYINVFGSVIDDPIPITNEISIQDSLGNERFKVAENGFMRFKGASFNNAAKQIEIDPLVGGVIFVSNTGNDATAEPENRNKPYQTLDAAINAYFNYPSIDYIEIISDTGFTISTALNNGTARKFDLRSEKRCTVTITRDGNLDTTLVTQVFNFKFLNGTLNFLADVGSGFGGFAANINIEVDTLSFSNWNIGAVTPNYSTFIIKAKTMTVNSVTEGVLQTPGNNRVGNITVDTLNFRGANSTLAGRFSSLELDFKLITHNNTFRINRGDGYCNITHGSISSIAPYAGTRVYYLKKALMNIVFTNGSTISSNVAIDCFNATGILTLSGNCNFQNSEMIIYGYNNSSTANQVFIRNASIKCGRLFSDSCLQNITIESSVITLSNPALGDMNMPSGGQIFANPTLTFIGTNYVFSSVNGSSLYVDEDIWTQPTKPTVNLEKGILYTNGKLDRSILNIIENPLNQYYDTIQRQLVLVDEKEEIVNKTLDSNKTYVINGTINLASGDYIEIPAGGLTIQGYGYDTSGIFKNTSGQSIFISPSGNSGNITLSSMFFNSSGLSSVFNNTDSTGGHAIELNDVNFNNVASLGTLNGYRQLTATTCGFYGCADGLTLEGSWSGLKIINSNIIGFGATGTLFKKGTSTLFSNRFYIDLNLQIATGSKICDFQESNFTNDKSLQVVNCYTKVNGIIDPSTTVVTFPNITPFSTKAYFLNNIGIQNSRYVVESAVNNNEAVNLGQLMTLTAGGTFTFNGDDATDSFLIPHGLIGTVKTHFVTRNSDASGALFGSVLSGSNILVTFVAGAPATGETIIVNWGAFK